MLPLYFPALFWLILPSTCLKNLKVHNTAMHFPLCWGLLQPGWGVWGPAQPAGYRSSRAQGEAVRWGASSCQAAAELQQWFSSTRAPKSASSQVCPRCVCMLVCASSLCTQQHLTSISCCQYSPDQPHGADGCSPVLLAINDHSLTILSFTAFLLSSSDFTPLSPSLVINRLSFSPGLFYY